MIQADIFNKNVEDYEAWFDNYPEVYQSERNAIKEQLQTLAENIRGIEVGVGTARFAQPLGIKEGVEPATEMARIAEKRGVEIMKGMAENLPYGDMQFDFVLFVTICHLDNIKLAMKEAYRVLKPKGTLIIGFLDKAQAIANAYKARGHRSTFFKNARFYTVKRVEELLASIGFKHMEFSQTLFGDLDDIKEAQQPKAGYGEGSFVVVKAIKK